MSFRPFTVLSFIVAAGFGWNLFAVKHATALLDRELASIAEQIKAAQKQKETLESVWGTLNDLPRLRQLSQQLLPQEMSQTPQNRSFAELERRLPPAQAPEAGPSAFALREGASAPGIAIALLPPETRVPQVILASTSAVPLPRHAAAVAAPVAPLPVVAAPSLAITPLGATPADAMEAEDALPLPPPVPPHLLALAEPRAVLTAAPRPVAAPAPRPLLPAVAAPVAQAAPTHVPVPVAPARPLPAAVARPLPTQEPPVRSLLGGLSAPLLAPPVPYGTASAATLGGFGR